MAANKSHMGYRRDSPYKRDPFIDIFTPSGTIDMSATDMDLMGIDEYGNRQVMKAGSTNPYIFQGQNVREIPMERGGNIYAQGGYSPQELLNFLYEGEKAPEGEQVQAVAEQHVAETVNERQQQDDADEILALQLAMETGEEYDINDLGNPYRSPSSGIVQQAAGVNPYLQQTQQDLAGAGLKNMGIWGDKAHQARKSDHNTGDAQDFGFDNPAVAEQTISQLQKEAKQRNVKYIIYNGRIWNPSISKEWRPYDGPNPHKEHFHVSYNR